MGGPQGESRAAVRPSGSRRDAGRRAQFRRRRATVAVALAGVVAAVVATTTGGGGKPTAATTGVTRHPPSGAQGSTQSGSRASTSVPAAAEAGLLPYALAAPISREVVQPGPTRGEVTIAGGLSVAGGSDSGVYLLDTATGALRQDGALAQATHDAAGALLGSRLLVVGGGTVAPSDVAQRVSVGATGVVAGTLPEARADASAASIGGTAYVVGGYDGPSLDPEVLATTDGARFRPVARLAVPVRYPAVVAVGTDLYVFGGQAADGRPVRTIQLVDPSRRTVTVVGELPVPLEGSAAGLFGSTVYLAGGDTASGASAQEPVATVYAFATRTRKTLVAGSLQTAVGFAGATVSGGRLWIVGGEVAGGSPTAEVQMVEPNARFGHAGTTGAGSPFPGDELLVADRGNDRLLLLDAAGKVVWRYPAPGRPAPPGGFYFPDDAFFIRHGTAIISNQEENETLVEIAFPSGRVTWQYGHPHVAGSAPGFLNNPDDAYLLKNGEIVVADPKNCRVLVLGADKRTLEQIGTVGACIHNPPTELGSPNGDTPLADGNILVSEINGSWIDEYTLKGKLVWTVHLPIGYPSDPQQIGPDRYLVADYENPGSVLEFNRAGQVLYRYRQTNGPGVLNQPSLAEVLPSGVIMLNDDYNDRIVAIDPATNATVWQYGVTGRPGTAPGLLNTPDGFDILGPHGTTPTHTVTG